MKKSDLKTGMIVKLNNGNRYLVLLNTERGDDLINLSGGFMALEDYEADLRHCDESRLWDIERVYSTGEDKHELLFNIKRANEKAVLLWKREEKPIEMTVAEIEKKLGIKNLKIVKE